MCVLDKKHNKPLPVVIFILLFVKSGTGTHDDGKSARFDMPLPTLSTDWRSHILDKYVIYCLILAYVELYIILKI